MTAPNAHDHTAADPDGTDHPSDVWMPTMLRPAPEPSEETSTTSDGVAVVAWHRVPEPPEPPWRSASRSRMVALTGGRQAGIDLETTAELARLRDAAAQANERLARQRALLDQLGRQLAEAQRRATTEGLAARQAERRVAELDHELALAHEELERLRALDLARTDRVVAQVEDHHRALVASLRSDPVPVGATQGDGDASTWYAVATDDDEPAVPADSDIGSSGDTAETIATPSPTLLALRHWLAPDDAVAVVDGDALASALAQDAASPADTDIGSQRAVAVAALHAGLGRRAAQAAIVFDGTLSAAAPAYDGVDADDAPRVLVTTPGVDVSTAVGALVGHDDIGPIVCIHESAADAGVITASYRLGIEALAEALTTGTT